MAFDNTVPYTISGTIDTNTNLITFVVSLYELDRTTNLYDNLQWTETFAIPASACGYKRNTNQVFIVTNESQDQFSIYQGWYDAEADITYTSITSALDDMVDALIAQQTGGGSTTIYTELTEAAAITAINAQGLVPGRMYRIELDGTSGGITGDYVYAQALSTDFFSREVQYFDVFNLQVVPLTGIFDETGWEFLSACPTATANSTSMYEFDSGSELLYLGTSNQIAPIYGIVEVGITANQNLETITGGFEGMEITIYATGGGAFNLSILDTGNIVFDASGLGPIAPLGILDDNQSFVTLRKRGSNWLLIQFYIH